MIQAGSRGGPSYLLTGMLATWVSWAPMNGWRYLSAIALTSVCKHLQKLAIVVVVAAAVAAAAAGERASAAANHSAYPPDMLNNS